MYPDLCPAGYDLVPTGAQQGGLECQCERNDKLIINCEDNQDTVIIEVTCVEHCGQPVASLAMCTLCTGGIHDDQKVCVHMHNRLLHPTACIHVAIANSTGSYMTVLEYLLLLAVNSQLC